MLKLRSIDLSDLAVFEGKQRIGRIRLATERMPCVWLERHHPPDRRPPHGLIQAWKALEARTPPEQLVAAYKAMNIRDDG